MGKRSGVYPKTSEKKGPPVGSGYLMTNQPILSERRTDGLLQCYNTGRRKRLSVQVLLARRVELFTAMFRISYPIAGVEI